MKNVIMLVLSLGLTVGALALADEAKKDHAEETAQVAADSRREDGETKGKKADKRADICNVARDSAKSEAAPAK